MTELEPAVAGFVLGVANAAHCAGMCGVFAIRAAARRGAASFASYAAGKTATYVAIGGIAGAAGRHVLDSLGAAQGWIAVAAGLLLVFAGVRMLRPAVAATAAAGLFAAPAAGLATAAHGTGSSFLTGAASGLLPCGIVWLAAAQAAAWGTPVRGAVSMAGFGVGTVPSLAACALLGSGLLARVGPARVRTAGGILCILAGVVAIARAVPSLLGADPGACCH